MLCGECSTDVPDEDVFCENCGSKLPHVQAAGEACVCGAPVAEADEDGFCQGCGRRVRRPPSDHLEQVISPAFAAVSDRGLRHERNEDRFAILREGVGYGLVVCDGVSATEHPEVASEAVTSAMAAALQAGLREGEVEDAEALLVGAIAAGVEELRERNAGAGAGENAASTTVVSALVLGQDITVAWVGDSRAYWTDASGTMLLTRDHSWMNMALDAGEMTREQIEAAPQAHAITRWVGADAGTAATPEVVRHAATGAGTLLLCTDGLWNYVPDAGDLGALLRRTDADANDHEDAADLARRLVHFANEQGGRDNVTVAVLQLSPEFATAEDAAPGE